MKYGYSYSGGRQTLHLRFTREKGIAFNIRFPKSAFHYRMEQRDKYLHFFIEGTQADIEYALRVAKKLDDIDDDNKDCLLVTG